MIIGLIRARQIKIGVVYMLITVERDENKSRDVIFILKEIV